MRLAYFLFKNEIPYTTNCKALVNTAFSIDLSEKLNSCILSLGKNVNYLSSLTISTFLNSFGKALKQKFINDFKNITNYSIMSDDAKSIKNENILRVYIRLFYNDQIIERFLESRKTTSTKSVNIKNEILMILDKFGLDKIKMISVSFDGASNFSGKKAGVQALLKIFFNLMYVHCRADAVQLCVVNANNKKKNIKRTLNLCNQISFLKTVPSELMN